MEINTGKVKTIFETMEYDRIEENVNIVKDWLTKRNNIINAYGDDNLIGIKKDINNVNSGEKIATIILPSDDIIRKITNLLDEKNNWNSISNFEKAKSIKKFASEIKQNEDLICKIESCTRGILLKDTKKYGVTLLVDCLEYFAQWAFSNTTTSNGPTIIYATNETCLGILGYALGPALANGSTVVLHVDPLLSIPAALLIELSIKAGIPEGVIKLLPSSGDLWMPKRTAMVYLFGDICTEKFQNNVLYLNKQVVALPNSKIPMIVLNNADIDSACECAVAAIWEYQGMLPWAVDTILVQEDIYPEFVEKLKRRIKTLRIGKGTDRLADISYPQSTEIEVMEKMVKDARAQGIDIYQPHQDNGVFYPTLFIGATVYTNNVLTENKNMCTGTSVLAFRSPKEAVALANNNRQGFATSVWCENISLINEISRQLNVGTIWVNSHGMFKPYISFTTHKLDGIGCIGGSLGFYEFKDQSYRSVAETSSKLLSNAVAGAQKAQSAWNALSIEVRTEKLYKWVTDVVQQKSNISTISNIDDLTTKLHECIVKCTLIDTSRTMDNFDLIVKREAVGVVVISLEDTIDIVIILSALLLGNAVILITKNIRNYDSLCKALPPGLLGTIDFSESLTVASIAQRYPRVVFIGVGSQSQRFQKCYNHSDNWDFILRRCCLFKNIWVTVGNSI